jgi:hypothetical protein
MILQPQKNFRLENFWYEPVFEKWFSKQKKNFGQKIINENFWLEPIFEEMILQP